MLALVKKDSLVYGPFLYFFLALFIIALTLIDLPAVFILVVGGTAISFSPFTYDEKNNANRFLVSMPVTRQEIITSRYLFSMLALMAVIFIEWLGVSLAGMTDIFTPTSYNLYDFLLIFCIGLIWIAICYPILYFFNNSYLVMAIILILLFVSTFFTLDPLVNIIGMTDDIVFNGIDKGFALLVETYIPFQPYLVTAFLTFLLFTGSIRLSGAILDEKDL